MSLKDENTKIKKTSSSEETEEETLTQAVVGWLWFFFKIGFVFSIILCLILGGLVFGIVKNVSDRIPIIADDSYRPKLTSMVYDCKGRLIAKLHAEENRTKILASHEIPAAMKQAVVAIEDERFYEHYGIDIYGIVRAMIINLKARRIVQGASTLTQQLVKNAFLTSEKTLKRKIIEALMAFQLERKYTKDEILTLYLNEIYFGHGVYGLAAASEQYFGKEPKDLTIAECAILAGIPKSPVGYSPIKHPKRNAERRSIVLSKMASLGFITPAEYETAVKEVVKILPLSANEAKAPYFTTYVRDQLLESYGADLLYTGGLKIYTSLDLDLQKYAEESMAAAPIFEQYPEDKYPDLNGSLICIDPKNGHIKAMYGGRNFKASQFNRVTQALRQPGSSFKPFVYICALEEGMLPNDKILDEPTSYTNPWNKEIWSPRNYDHKFHGEVTMMKSVCKSYNVPAVRLIDKLTPAKVIRVAKRMGIVSEMQPNLSLALGAGQFTPLEMASAFGVFANNGIHCAPLSILKVVDRDNNVLKTNVPRAREVLKAIDAAMMCDMLRTVVERGSGARARIRGRAVGGKTGTTNDYVDAWFNGITPDLVTVVQFGFDMPKTLGKHKSGGAVCCTVWKNFMEKALADYPASDFPVPEGGVRCKVCMTSGLLASPKCPSIEVTKQIFPNGTAPTAVCNHAAYVAAAKARAEAAAAAAAAEAMGNATDSAIIDDEIPPEAAAAMSGFFSDSYSDDVPNTDYRPSTSYYPSSDSSAGWNSMHSLQKNNISSDNSYTGSQRSFIPLKRSGNIQNTAPSVDVIKKEPYNDREPGVYTAPLTTVPYSKPENGSNTQHDTSKNVMFHDNYY